MIRRLLVALKLAWFGITRPDLFAEGVFVPMSQLLEAALHVAHSDKPCITHLTMADKRIVSFWIYPVLSKNPTDRITELLAEIEALRGFEPPTT